MIARTAAPDARIKYPRTCHLPWSEGVSSDDKVIETLDGLIGQHVVVTEKMDGENTSLYNNCNHARSLDSRSHPSRDWLKQFWDTFRSEIPDGWRICGENLFAQHSIHYKDLPAWFMGFSVWDNHNICLPWKETLEWFSLLGIAPVPVLYEGVFEESLIRGLWTTLDPAANEGYVVRVAGEIPYADFRRKVAKFVRRGHVQTDTHWMHGPIQRNLLASE